MRAQQSLQALPGHVLRHANTFHTYIRLFVDDANILDTQRGGSAKAAACGGMAEVSGALRKLLDEIAALGNIGEARKEEILQDPDARHVCDIFTMSCDCSLYHHSHRHCSCYPWRVRVPLVFVLAADKSI
jgi:hypothetical protein